MAMGKSPLAVRCPVCSASNFRIKYRGLEGVNGKRYDLITCVICDFSTISPMPSAEELANFYSCSYMSRTKTNIYNHLSAKDFIDTNKSDIEDNLALLSLIEPYRTAEQKRLLDVGCGHGFMCYAATLRGYDALGVDYDADAKRIGETHLGVKIISGTIADVAERHFDLVTEIMTLEHVLEPAKHVALIKERLNDSGLYAGSVPNIDGVYARLRGRNWYHIVPPEHLNYFSTKTLKQFLQNAGFEVLYIGTIPLYAAPTICFGIRSRLNELIARQKNALVKRMLTVLYRMLTLLKRYAVYKPINFLILTFKIPGNGIFWVARKKAQLRGY